MKRISAVCLTLLFSLSLFVTSAFAGDMQQALLGKLPQKGNQLTRGEFISMLVTAAELPAPQTDVQLPADVPADAWYASDMKAALAAGILKGTAQNTVAPTQTITQAQAVVLVSRAMNLPGVEAPGPVATPVAKNHWAYVPFTWLVKEGIVSPGSNAEEIISPESGAALLERVFGSKEQAKEIIEKNQAAHAKVKTQRVAGDMTMTMQANPAVKVQEMPATISMKAKVTQEMNLEQGIRQQFTMSFTGMPVAIPPMEMEQYMTAQGLFMKMQDPTSGQVTWIKMTQDVPNIVELMQQQTKVMGVPAEMEKYFRYRLVGEQKLGDKTYYVISFYGNISDLNQFMSLLGEQTGMTKELTKGLDQSAQMIKGITMVGRMFVDPTTYLAEKVNSSAVVAFADKFEGQAFPLKSMSTSFDFQYKDLGSNIEIKLPKEALEAPEMGATPTAPPTK